MPYLVIAGLIVVVIIMVAVVLMSPAAGPGPATPAAPALTVQPTSAEESLPPQPTCTIGITGSKVSSTTLRLQVMTTTCGAGELTGLKVSINGVQQIVTLGSNPGASGTFAGTSGSNSVIVTANFANGAQAVVYQNTL
jgi:hypothetical protein